jgi:ABC-type Na+ efflux pump permease subunit
MYPLWVILRHTMKEAVVQPIYTLLLTLGAVIVLIFGALPFFTLGEDTVMFKAVTLDVVLVLVLLSTLFATSKSIFEEIEDRTMLTLMSKPVRKWQVLVGKYLGIIAAAAIAVAILGAIVCLCVWWRVPGDNQFNVASLDERELKGIADYRWMHIAGLIPSFVLIWFQISVLAAISVAISTRFSLVVNLPTVILIYIGGNLTRFLLPLTTGAVATRGAITQGAAYVVSVVLPFLETFDIRQKTVYSPIALKGTQFVADVRSVSVGEIWKYVGIAAMYALCYAVFALSAGLFVFQSRELGGAEG